MRFPVDVAVLQKVGDTECPLVFSETPTRGGGIEGCAGEIHHL
jgi:hypothetical protein